MEEESRGAKEGSRFVWALRGGAEMEGGNINRRRKTEDGGFRNVVKARGMQEANEEEELKRRRERKQ